MNDRAMTEKEKAAAGQLFDPSLIEGNSDAISRCLDLCHIYNGCMPSDTERRSSILRQIIGEMGEDVTVTSPFWCDHGYNIKIGNHFYSNHNLVITDGLPVTFGDHVLIAPNCCITTAEHPISPEDRKNGLEFAAPVTVGNNVWIGMGVTVLAGVTIGDGAVIGAGSVVTHDIPPYTVAVGVPCRVIREIPRDSDEK